MEANLPSLLQGGFFIVLLAAASFWDIRKRMIPDSLCLCIALLGLLDFEPGKVLGILAAVPFLLAALIWGGMGGGDIKLTAAAGVVLGLYEGVAAMVIGLTAMLLFHTVYGLIRRLCGRTVPKAYPLAPFLAAGCLISNFMIS